MHYSRRPSLEPSDGQDAQPFAITTRQPDRQPIGPSARPSELEASTRSPRHAKPRWPTELGKTSELLDASPNSPTMHDLPDLGPSRHTRGPSRHTPTTLESSRRRDEPQSPRSPVPRHALVGQSPDLEASNPQPIESPAQFPHAQIPSAHNASQPIGLSPAFHPTKPDQHKHEHTHQEEAHSMTRKARRVRVRVQRLDDEDEAQSHPRHPHKQPHLA